MLVDPMDFEALFGTGVQVSRLQPAFARALLRQVEAVDYVPDQMMKGAAGAATRSRARWHVEHSPPDPGLAQIGQRLLEGWLRPLLSLYRSSAVADARVLLYRCHRGYEVGWHDHLDYPSVLTLLIYLTSQTLEEGDGGQLEVAKVRRDGQSGDVLGRQVTARVQPQQGVVALIDSQSPLFQHRVAPFTSDKPRFLLTYSIGSFFAEAGTRPALDHGRRD